MGAFEKAAEGGFTIAGYAADDVQDHMAKVLSAKYVATWFAGLSSFFFGLLLLSAAHVVGDAARVRAAGGGGVFAG